MKIIATVLLARLEALLLEQYQEDIELKMDEDVFFTVLMLDVNNSWVIVESFDDLSAAEAKVAELQSLGRQSMYLPDYK